MSEMQPDIGGDSKSVANTTSTDSPRSRYYENVPGPSRPFSAGGFNPMNNQTSPTFQNYSEHSPRPASSDSRFTSKDQSDTSSNSIQGNVHTPESRISAQQMESLRMQLSELPPSYQDPPPTQNQRRSLDENTRLSFVGEGRNHVTPFVPQHRRGRSDEVARCFEGTSHINRNIRYGSPPLVRAAPMVHSFSTSSLDQQQQQQQQHHPHNYNHSLHHSASIDNASLYNSYIHGTLINDNMYQQNTAYVKLTTGINMAQRKLKDLEKEKEACEKELNDLLSVQNNPTEKDFRQLRNESTILHQEIAQMYNECDKMSISIDPERGLTRQLPFPSTPLFRTPSPTKTQTMPTMNTNPMFPYGNGEHLTSSVITKKPLPPTYRTISDPAPPYSSLHPEGSRQVPDFYRSTSDVPRRPPPPIRPIRPLPLLRPAVPTTSFQPSDPPPGAHAHSHVEDEHWECPSCTFKNLLVAECEVCYTRRPAKNVRLS